jgi:uncharacterized protein
MDIIKVGDVLDFTIIGLDTERRRISLSRKSGAGTHSATKTGGGAAAKQTSTGNAGSAPRDGGVSGGKKKVTVVKKQDFNAHDDGLMYNPFAEAFKKR